MVENQAVQQDRFNYLMERAEIEWKSQISTLQDKLDNINQLRKTQQSNFNSVSIRAQNGKLKPSLVQKGILQNNYQIEANGENQTHSVLKQTSLKA